MDETPPDDCPRWCCGDHLPSADGVVHVSADEQLLVAAGRERSSLFVSLEQVGELAETASVRLEGASSAPMTPAYAMQLAALLQTAAFAAIRAARCSR